VTSALVLAGVALGLALGAWAAWRAVMDRPVVVRQLFAAGAVEAFLVAQAIVVLVQGDGRGDAKFWLYALTQAVLLPLAALWAFAERSRWSSVVLAVAALTVAFLQYRLLQVWEAG
jgi:hypothetical protein